MRWLAAIIESSWALWSWSSTWLQCTVTRSPGFQLRTAVPTFSTTPEASLPTTWYGWSWRLAHSLSRPRRAIGPNVLTGSKMLDPHRVEVDAAGHHGEVHLVGRELGGGHLADVQALARVLLLRRHALPHVLLVLQDVHGAVALGDGQVGEVVAAGAGLDGVEDVLHPRDVTDG